MSRNYMEIKDVSLSEDFLETNYTTYFENRGLLDGVDNEYKKVLSTTMLNVMKVFEDDENVINYENLNTNILFENVNAETKLYQGDIRSFVRRNLLPLVRIAFGDNNAVFNHMDFFDAINNVQLNDFKVSEPNSSAEYEIDYTYELGRKINEYITSNAR